MKVIYSHVRFALTNHCTLFIDSSNFGKSLDSMGYMPAKTCRLGRRGSTLILSEDKTYHGLGWLKTRHRFDRIPDTVQRVANVCCALHVRVILRTWLRISPSDDCLMLQAM